MCRTIRYPLRGPGPTRGVPRKRTGPARASYDALLRELIDERTYPHLYRLAWSPKPDGPRSEREEFLFGVDTILDGVQALINRTTGGY